MDGFDDRRFSSPTIILCGCSSISSGSFVGIERNGEKCMVMVCRSCSLLCYVDETKTKKCFRFDAKRHAKHRRGKKIQSNTAAAKQSKQPGWTVGRGARPSLQIQRRHTHRKEIRSLRTTRAPALRIRMMVVRMVPVMMRVNLVHRTPIRRFLLH